MIFKKDIKDKPHEIETRGFFFKKKGNQMDGSLKINELK